jgi:hypothetical protein
MENIFKGTDNFTNTFYVGWYLSKHLQANSLQFNITTSKLFKIV